MDASVFSLMHFTVGFSHILQCYHLHCGFCFVFFNILSTSQNIFKVSENNVTLCTSSSETVSKEVNNTGGSNNKWDIII